MDEEVSLEKTRLLGKKLLTSVANVNNAPRLLSILASCSPVAGSDATQCRLEALCALHAFFVSLLRAGKLYSTRRKAGKNAIGTVAVARDDSGHDAREDGDGHAEARYREWLWSRYRNFKYTLFRIVFRQPSPRLLQLSSMNTLMDFVRDERPGEFSNALYLKICERMVGYKGETNDILQHLFIANYFKYCDVRYFTYCNLEKIVVRLLARKQGAQDSVSSDEDNTQMHSGASSHKLVLNVFEILSNIPTPAQHDQKDGSVDEDVWAYPSGGIGEKVVTGAEQRKAGKKKPTISADNVANQKDHKKQKAAFSRAWLAFLRHPIPADIYKKVLARLHQNVIPFMTNPVLLSDFLTQSYNTGGLIGVMALSSLFILITKYGLEYPDFYNKLYAQLEPSIFVAKYRSHFFELLDTCLKSSLLPSYLGAAFAKKLGRLVLSAPPSGAIVVIALIHNLLRRHPSINVLVHRPGAPRSSVNEENEETHKVTNSDSELEEEQEVHPEERQGRLGADPFVATETDTAKSNALKSSLWEIETLRRHYCPAVSRFVESLETDLTIRAKTTEVSIGDFSPASYGTIFGEEVGRRLKSVPMAFYSSVPNTIFPKTNSDDTFKGWRFEELPGRQADKHEASMGNQSEKVLADNSEDVNGKSKQDVTLEHSVDDTPSASSEEDTPSENSVEDARSEEFTSDGSGGSRSRSEQSEGEDWHQPLMKKSRGSF